MLSPAAEQLAGMVAVVRRDADRFFSYRTAALASAASELVSMILFYYVSRLVRVEPFPTPDDYFAFVVVGLVALQLANAVLYFPLYLLTTELVAGTFERLVVSPLGAVTGSIATMLFPFVSAVGASIAALAFAAVVFGLPLSWATVPLALPAAVLVGLSFAPLGILLMGAGLVMKRVSFLSGWLVTALSLLAGLYFPVALLPGWIRWASNVQPLTPAVDLMRHLLIGTSLPDPVWVEVAKLVGFAVVLLPPALWVLSAAVRVSRRRGTILEY
jgi:lipooligosaccharide transport system permease protein